MASLENFRLVVFRAVASQCSFRKAAEELYLTQPAVSLQIKALEEDLGLQLFDRSGARVTLTPAGKTLLDYANESSALLLRAEHALAALSGNHAGQLALGASTTIAQYVLPRLLSDFRREHPRVHPTLLIGNTEHIVRALAQRQIDLGLLEGPARSRDVKTEPFLVDELVFIVSGSHPWADRPSIACHEITTIPLVMRERGSGTRQVIELALKHHRIRAGALQVAMELDSTEAIKSAIEAGLGAGFVSRWALARDLRVGNALRVLPIQGLRIRRDFHLARLAGPAPQGLAQEFRRFLFAHTGTRRAASAARKPAVAAPDKKRK